jgi:carotenoid cleavage dioxygenase
MNLRTGAVTKRQLDDRIGEFPVVNLDMTGVKTRWSYHVSMAPEELQRFDGLYKYDLGTGQAQTWRFSPGVGGSEPAFAPRIGATSEDDGYVIVFTTDPEGKSEVQVLAARDFEAGPIARIPLPVRVPAGFHGTWAPGDLMAAER